MIHTARKRFRACGGMDKMLIRMMGILIMLAFIAGITSVPVLAASNGIYIATATPHYKHPTTGKIEDAGGEGSSVLGQSMTESATYKKALVEVDAAGNTYITVRLQLMDNIQNPQFQVDGKGVSASLMQEDYTNNTADYRMKVNSENSIIRCNMYVVAMGRDVIFYITVSNLQSGSGDFITSVKVEQPKQPDPVQTQPPVQTQKPVVSPTPVPTTPPVTETPIQIDSAETTSPDAQVQNSQVPNTTTPSIPDATEPPAKDSDTALGLLEFDKDGNEVTNSKLLTETQQFGGTSSGVWWILGSIVVVAAVGSCIWYFCFFKKKK